MTQERFNELNKVYPPKPVNYFPVWVVITLLVALFAFAGGVAYTYSERPVFDDVNGNPLPYHAVDSLVYSTYLHISLAGQDTIRKYFNQ